jgi:hypothetical protein
MSKRTYHLSPTTPSPHAAASPPPGVSTSASPTTAGTEAFTGALNDTACCKPKSAGGWGWCGPLSCKDTYVTCTAEGGGGTTVDGVAGTYARTFSASVCQSYLPRTSMPDLTDWRPKFQCKQCTQQTTGVCSAIFLSKVIAGDGVKYAYCNDKWLVVGASGHPGVFSANLNDVPFPPGAPDSMRTETKSQDETRRKSFTNPFQ